MSNVQFQRYVDAFLNELPQTKGHKPFANYIKLAEAAGLSRQTLYNWFNGQAATRERVEKLADGMITLDRQAASEAGLEARAGSKDVISQKLWSMLQEPSEIDSSSDSYCFVPFQPICGTPHSVSDGVRQDGPSWSFLGSVVCTFLSVTDQADRNLDDCSISNLTRFRGRDVLVGLFSTPDRYKDWDFIRTPLQIPLSGVVIREDLNIFLKHVLALKRKTLSELGEDEYARQLMSAIWRPFSSPIETAPNVREEIQPIAAPDEAGWHYAVDVLGYGHEELEKYAPGPNQFDADAFSDALSVASKKFQQQCAGERSSKGRIRLPVTIVDEFTALNVIRKISNLTDTILLSDLVRDAWQPGRISRPRYSPAIAFRRDPGSVTPSRTYHETKRMFDDFIWTNASIVAGHYVRLYRELVARFENLPGMGDWAPLYFLRWLSLNISQNDLQYATSDDRGGGELADVPDLGPWRAVLRTAKAMIIEDDELRNRLEALLKVSWLDKRADRMRVHGS